jgi:hypothetical protein
MVRAVTMLLSLSALLPPVGFGFCATEDGHFEFGFFEAQAEACCTTAPVRVPEECGEAQCGRCEDVALSLQSAIRIDTSDSPPPDLWSAPFDPLLHDLGARPATDASTGLRRGGLPTALETTLLRP